MLIPKFSVLVSTLFFILNVDASLTPELSVENSRFSQYILKDTDLDYPLKTYPLFIGSYKEYVCQLIIFCFF